jgi:hypothetical protein
MTKTSALAKADTLFSRSVRGKLGGRCYAEGQMFECKGYIQCCHIISRRYRAVRWIEENAEPMCAAHHLWYTHHPLEWQDFIGEDRWEDLRYRALNDPPERAVDALERLKAI